jgi:crotonobetainyl-CoA:carnitine CoA-transferase CaiB-like acyl-CoA transferase
MKMDIAAPLAGISVVEIGQNVSGPFAGQIFADLGAEVTKIEKPSGDDTRRWGPEHPAGGTWIFQIYNRNKRSFVAQLNTAKGREEVVSLIKGADILIQNMRPNACEHVGLGSDELLRVNPRLIYCSIWAFGRVGTMRMHPGYDPIATAYSGLMHLNSGEDGIPRFVGIPLLDKGSGMWIAIGALAALAQRARTGKGCVVDTSLLETGLSWLDSKIALHEATGHVPNRASASDTVAPFESFHASDGPIVLGAGNDRQFAILAGMLGHPEWRDDIRFVTNAARLKNRAQLAAAIQSVVLDCPREEWVNRLTGADVLFAPVLTVDEALNHPQVIALNQLGAGAAAGMLRLPLSFDGVRPAIRSLAPRLGAEAQLMEEVVNAGKL